MNTYHVVPACGKADLGPYAVRATGGIRALTLLANKKEAVDYGRSLAKEAGSKTYVHDFDGTILRVLDYTNKT
jgi:hypothetical protein